MVTDSLLILGIMQRLDRNVTSPAKWFATSPDQQFMLYVSVIRNNHYKFVRKRS